MFSPPLYHLLRLRSNSLPHYNLLVKTALQTLIIIIITSTIQPIFIISNILSQLLFNHGLETDELLLSPKKLLLLLLLSSQSIARRRWKKNGLINDLLNLTLWWHNLITQDPRQSARWAATAAVAWQWQIEEDRRIIIKGNPNSGRG